MPFEVVRDPHISLYPTDGSQLVTYLRLAYCESVCIVLRCIIRPPYGEHLEATGSTLFGEIVLPNTLVHVLTLRMKDACVFHAQRKYQPTLTAMVPNYWPFR